MSCLISTIIGTGLLGATFMTMTVTKEQHDLLRNKLSPELDKVYTKIATERRNHYIQGLSLGLLVTYLVLNNYNLVISNKFHKLALVTAITLSVSVMYYLLMPKSDYILNYLKTPEENKAWLEIYKLMKQRYLIGLLLGSASAIYIANSMC